MKDRSIARWPACLLTILAACASGPRRESHSPVPLSGYALREREAARVERRERIATPGTEHRKLDSLAGDFRVTIRHWPNEDAQPIESQATATNVWILGGRFLQCELRGELDGKPWERRTFLGYDKARGEYVEMRVDSATTEMLEPAAGTWSSDASEIVFQRTYDDPVEQKRVHLREVLHVQDWQHHESELWIDPPGGQAHLALEMSYERIR